MRCHQCSREIPEGSVVCPFCAAPVADAPTSATAPSAPGESGFDEAVTSMEPGGASPGDAATSAAAPSTTPSMSFSDSGHHGRFLPGATVAERYRIVGLLGRGGMGEVYRADDLKLGQQVALKFLPRQMVADDAQVRLLFDEVRMAHKVSHPNVCRVWDVGETDGLHYVSMEYVDGEDMASLLRRIGRLPEDKAVEIARQLCAALAAAHDEGVLHRDLKPANIMLDGRGRVKLTDFGLAAVAEVRAGTPIYMAPEQLSGKEVSVKSDIYSLGLVLHELFTGKRVFEADNFEELSRLHQSSTTGSMTRTSGLDPATDRVIQRCLEADPAKRPKSALTVAAGMPGADPLAAALAAGEMPSPEMVAEAGGEGSLSLAVAVPLLLFSLIAAVAVGILQSNRSLVGWVPFDLSPAMLDARAREIITDLGYELVDDDIASAYAPNLRYVSWLRGQDVEADRWEVVASGRLPAIVFWWRSAPSVLNPRPIGGPGLSNAVTPSNPPRTTPGMISLQLDTLGRLVWLDVVPDRVADTPAPPADAAEPQASVSGSADWDQLFGLMGLEMSSLSRSEPLRRPEHYADERAAWEGAYPEDAETTLRIEAAALEGRLMSLRLYHEDAPLAPPTPSAATTDTSDTSDTSNTSDSGSGISVTDVATAVVALGVLAMLLTAIFGGLYVGQRNVRAGRGDSRGARRLSFTMAIVLGVSWLLGEHTYTPNDLNSFFEMLIFASAASGLTWALYLAVEPFMRRHAPER